MQEVGRHSLELEPVILLGVNLWTAHSLEEKLHGRAAAVNSLVFIAASVVGAHKGVTFGDVYPPFVAISSWMGDGFSTLRINALTK